MSESAADERIAMQELEAAKAPSPSMAGGNVEERMPRQV
jgi:hypothetical protein